jgi:Photosynthesis system II assembly factor YCF48
MGSQNLASRVAGAMAALVLAGCGAGAQVPGTNARNSTLRTDQFQAIASNSNRAVAVRYGGLAVLTRKGEMLARLDLPGAPALIDVTACADGSFAALDFDRKVWVADAEAANWKPMPLQGKFRPLALTCNTKNQLWVVGSDTTIASSNDKGANWTARNFKKDAMLNSVQFLDDTHAFITGEFGMLLRSEDGGATWNADAKIPEDFYPYAALFVTRAEGYVTGLAGTILKTTDSGLTWNKTENVSGLPQFGLARHGTTVYSVGAGGSLQRLDGNRWLATNYGTRAPAYLRALNPLGSDGALIAGGAGAIHHVSLPPETAGKAQ